MLWQKRTYKRIAWVLGHKTQNDKAQLEIKPAVDFKEMAGYVGEERVVGISWLQWGFPIVSPHLKGEEVWAKQKDCWENWLDCQTQRLVISSSSPYSGLVMGSQVSANIGADTVQHL